MYYRYMQIKVKEAKTLLQHLTNKMYSELCIKKTDMKYGFTQQYAVRPKTK